MYCLWINIMRGKMFNLIIIGFIILLFSVSLSSTLISIKYASAQTHDYNPCKKIDNPLMEPLDDTSPPVYTYQTPAIDDSSRQ